MACTGNLNKRIEDVREPLSEGGTLVKTVVSFYCPSCGQVCERYVESCVLEGKMANVQQ